MRLGTGPFPYAAGRIWKLILGIVCVLGGWIALKEGRWDYTLRLGKRLRGERGLAGRFLRRFFLPSVTEGSYSLFTQAVLTAVMYGGLGMIVLSFLSPPSGFESGFWGRRDVLRSLGLLLAGLSSVLRRAKKTAGLNDDWLRASEILPLVGLAAAITGIDMYFSARIGLLAMPPVYDGVGYLVDAKRLMLQLPDWSEHPVHTAQAIMGNRYPVWLALMALNFSLFDMGQWQGYAVRFWPTLIILGTTFWVVRRRGGPAAGWAATLFIGLAPTLSGNLRSAAAGHLLFAGGYLSDLRPDLLFAAFSALTVVLLVEHSRTFDDRTAVLAGGAAALAILTKSSAIGALLVACSVAGAYVLVVNRADLKRNLQISLWSFLIFAILLTPWLLAGGLDLTVTYVREVLTTLVPLYSSSNPTFRSEATYYLPLLIDHMGWGTVAVALLGGLLLLLGAIRSQFPKFLIQDALVYLSVAIGLYVLVSVALAKNYFLGLPSYLVFWAFCCVAVGTFIGRLEIRSTRIARTLIAVTIGAVVLMSVLGVRGLFFWQGHEFEEGRQDRAVLQQMAADLHEVLSKGQSFFPMAAYGNPATLWFYFPKQELPLPDAVVLDGSYQGSVDDFVMQHVDRAKAVFIYSGRNKASSFKGYAPPATWPFYEAAAEWVQRPGSKHRLWKTYQFYRARGDDQAAVELYVRDDSR